MYLLNHDIKKLKAVKNIKEKSRERAKSKPLDYRNCVWNKNHHSNQGMDSTVPAHIPYLEPFLFCRLEGLSIREMNNPRGPS